MNRRDFIKRIGGALGAVMAAPLVALLPDPTPRKWIQVTVNTLGTEAYTDRIYPADDGEVVSKDWFLADRDPLADDPKYADWLEPRSGWSKTEHGWTTQSTPGIAIFDGVRLDSKNPNVDQYNHWTWKSVNPTAGQVWNWYAHIKLKGKQ